ncbi:MAG: hypothetical protein LBH28_12215 [Oscillospiraceae bacterium]|jgi:hypothetical protein|nr:hypothetical protein [Oscillospiraceae bacterium]
MMKKLITFLLVFLIFLFLMACPNSYSNDDNQNNSIIEFGIQKSSNISFTLTINGADWNESTISNSMKMLIFSNLTSTHRLSQNGGAVFFNSPVRPEHFDLEINGKVITASLKNYYAGYYFSNLKGTLLLTAESLNNFINNINANNPLKDNNIYKIMEGKGSVEF